MIAIDTETLPITNNFYYISNLYYLIQISQQLIKVLMNFKYEINITRSQLTK